MGCNVGLRIVILQMFVAIADIVVPTPAQLRYQSTDFVALIHFNMGTYAHNGDPCCDASNWAVKAPYAAGETRDPATFDPTRLNTTQWFESITALGASIAVLTAKHGCGFTLWPTKSKLPDGSPYGYSVGSERASIKHDVLEQFVDAARAAGVGYGFYYSIMKNFFLCRGFTGASICSKTVLPGQHNLSLAEYTRIATEQVTELWTRYGNLTQIWVDSGDDGLGDLMVRLQPQAANTPANPVAWCGTESGHPSRDVGGGEIWNTDPGFFGNPNGTQWIPKMCDPQLFQDHIWFWEPHLKVRTLAMMIPIYHDIVGRGMTMELAFSIDRDGLVEASHAQVYKQLGDWVRTCYGSPLASTSGIGNTFLLNLMPGQVVDRFQLEEDISLGQRVRNYTIRVRDSLNSWSTLVEGSAIGRKRIHILGGPITVSSRFGSQLQLLVSHAIARPQVKAFMAFKPCPDGASQNIYI